MGIRILAGLSPLSLGEHSAAKRGSAQPGEVGQVRFVVKRGQTSLPSPWSSGYDIAFTWRRSPVRIRSGSMDERSIENLGDFLRKSPPRPVGEYTRKARNTQGEKTEGKIISEGKMAKVRRTLCLLDPK